MRAVGVVPGRREVELVDHPRAVITAPNQVRFKTLEIGICGTDKEICTFVYGSAPAGFDYLVLGHEALGEVVEVGDEVRGFKPGDLVVPSVRRPCLHPQCAPCRAGLQDFCSTGDFTERGIKMTHGFLTEQVVEDQEFLNAVPRDLRDVAVLVEPLTVAEKALSQVWKIQKRLPWEGLGAAGQGAGHGRNALVLGAGPVGILGAMLLASNGFKTCVYSRSKAPNPKAELLEAIGIPYYSALDISTAALAERLGNIDVVYEALGVASVSFEVLKVLGLNGVFVFTGIPAPREPIPVEADNIMRNLVLMNQTVVGTVNADKESFENAIRDLQVFKRRWPGALQAIITGRFPMSAFRSLLTGDKNGIKNIITVD